MLTSDHIEFIEKAKEIVEDKKKKRLYSRQKSKTESLVVKEEQAESQILAGYSLKPFFYEEL